MLTQAELQNALQKGLTASQRCRLQQAVVAVAGCGGLGSNAAAWLARLGVGHLLLIDFDKVEPGNLNRQYYFLEDIGRYKAEALRERLLRVNPYGDYQASIVKLTEQNIPRLLAKTDIVCEALDKADSKAMLVNGVIGSLPDTKIVAASGIAGFGSGNEIRTRRLTRRLYICGDGSSSIDALPLCGARVGIAAAHQALTIARLLLDLEEA